MVLSVGVALLLGRVMLDVVLFLMNRRLVTPKPVTSAKPDVGYKPQTPGFASPTA